MATKKVSAVIKLQCPAGAATPAPPIGPALGPHGVSAPKFVQEFNDRTKNMEKGLVIPVYPRAREILDSVKEVECIPRELILPHYLYREFV